jgi:glucosamine-6-phosphate deaminase
VVISPSRAEMGQTAATRIADHLRSLLAQQDEVRMIFAAAPSQSDMLAHLVDAPGIDWSRVVAFHMDEYVGLAPDASQRFAKWLEAEIFSKLPFKKIHSIRPEPDAHVAAKAYAAALCEAPIDVVCLGIGVNGHIAFNDPPVADFNDPLDVKQVELDDVCRQQQVDDKCFPTFDDVPTHALTLTIPRLLRANAMFCVVPGAQKRDAVIATLSGPISTDCPASILRSHNNCTLFLDNESAP